METSDIRTEHFRVLEETDGFVSVELDMDALFNSVPLRNLKPEMMASWHQYLKDHYSVVHVQQALDRIVIFRKLIDSPKLFR